MGAATVLCAWAALAMALRRARLSISATTITYTSARIRGQAGSGQAGSGQPGSGQPGSGQALVLDHSAGTALQLVRVTRPGRSPVTGLTIPDSGTILPVPGFDLTKIRAACTARGWRFLPGIGTVDPVPAGPGAPDPGSGAGPGVITRRLPGQLSGVRITCGIIWAVITVICAAGGVGELTIGNGLAAIMCFAFAAGTGWYDIRVWTSRARLLLLILAMISERPPRR
jgi:hypothetical protein